MKKTFVILILFSLFSLKSSGESYKINYLPITLVDTIPQRIEWKPIRDLLIFNLEEVKRQELKKFHFLSAIRVKKEIKFIRSLKIDKF